ncbi:MAG: hypothetical protein FWD67_07335 [Betaproteobacteria bacterium]|nr:hypothetical protein [Betaproteobacteria bacterium]
MADNPKPLKRFILPFPKTRNQDGSVQEIDPFEFLITWGKSAKDGFFPLGESGQCHGGIHFDESTGRELYQADGIRCIADGEVIAYRFDREMPVSNYDNNRKARYSTSFVLVRHRLQIPADLMPPPNNTSNPPDPPSCVFYSLYMHLKHWKAYEDDETIKRPSFLAIYPTQRIVGNRAYDVAPSGSSWTNSSPPVRQKGLKVDNGHTANAQQIGWLPRNARITLVGNDLGNGKYRLASIDSGTSFMRNGTTNLCTNGVVDIWKLDPIITGPAETDKVHILATPVEIKAGEFIGHIGEYHRFDADVSTYQNRRWMTHLEVFAGSELENFIAQCQAADGRAAPDAKSLLVIECGAEPALLSRPNAKVDKGDLFRKVKNCKAEGPWIKMERGESKVEAKSALSGWVANEQKYNGGKLLFAATVDEHGSNPIYANDYNNQTTHTYRKVFTPSGTTFVWVDRGWYEGSMVAGRNKNKNEIVEAVDDYPFAYERFPPLQTVNREHKEPAAATMVVDLKKKNNPIIGVEAKDDQGVRWWGLKYPTDAFDWGAGYVCERGFNKVRFCTMWAWPGFERSENTSSVEEWFDLRLEKKYKPSNKVLENLFYVVDRNGDRQLTGQELKQAWSVVWFAQPLSRQIVKNRSEWGLPKSEWDALDKQMKAKGKTASGIDYMEVWEEEKKRIVKLRFWDEVKAGVVGFPDMNVYHIHPLALIENFAGLRAKGVTSLSEKGYWFIFHIEGGDNPITRSLHCPGFGSGVTIGPGYDMRERRPADIKSDLMSIGLSESVATTFSGGSGLKDIKANPSTNTPENKAATNFSNANKDLASLTLDQRMALLKIIAPHYEGIVKRNTKEIPLEQHEYDALVCFTYNPSDEIRSVTNLIKTGKNDNNQTKIDEAMDGIMSRNPFSPSSDLYNGINNRRSKEVYLFKFGVYTDVTEA